MMARRGCPQSVVRSLMQTLPSQAEKSGLMDAKYLQRPA